MKSKWKYEIIIYWSEEDQAYIAEVPELPGCAAGGKTYKQALANVEVIIQEWIETAKELKRPVPEPKGRLLYAKAETKLSATSRLKAARTVLLRNGNITTEAINHHLKRSFLKHPGAEGVYLLGSGAWRAIDVVAVEEDI
jgi:predicted RNase H-like HicB family nuclease